MLTRRQGYRPMLPTITSTNNNELRPNQHQLLSISGDSQHQYSTLNSKKPNNDFGGQDTDYSNSQDDQESFLDNGNERLSSKINRDRNSADSVLDTDSEKLIFIKHKNNSKYVVMFC